MTNCVNKRNQKGFTLTELIIVIVIIGILAAVLIPSLSGYISKAKKSAAEQDALSMHKEYLATLDSDEYLEKSTATFFVYDEDNEFLVIIKNGSLDQTFSGIEENAILSKLKTEKYSSGELEANENAEEKDVVIYQLKENNDDTKPFIVTKYVENASTNE